jgi:hypothetical protein
LGISRLSLNIINKTFFFLPKKLKIVKIIIVIEKVNIVTIFDKNVDFSRMRNLKFLTRKWKVFFFSNFLGFKKS